MNDEKNPVVAGTDVKKERKELSPKVKKGLIIFAKAFAIIGTGVVGYLIGRHDGMKAVANVNFTDADANTNFTTIGE